MRAMKNRNKFVPIGLLAAAAVLFMGEFVFHGGLLLVIGLGCAAVGTAALLVKKHPVAAGIVGVIVYLLLLTELLMNGRILFSVPVSAVIITAVVTGIKRRARIRAGTKTDNGARGNKSST